MLDRRQLAQQAVVAARGEIVETGCHFHPVEVEAGLLEDVVVGQRQDPEEAAVALQELPGLAVLGADVPVPRRVLVLEEEAVDAPGVEKGQGKQGDEHETRAQLSPQLEVEQEGTGGGHQGHVESAPRQPGIALGEYFSAAGRDFPVNEGDPDIGEGSGRQRQQQRRSGQYSSGQKNAAGRIRPLPCSTCQHLVQPQGGQNAGGKGEEEGDHGGGRAAP